MEINPQEFAQKLSEKYQLQCLQFFQEILSLQTELELKNKHIAELESKLEKQEGVNVNSTSNT